MPDILRINPNDSTDATRMMADIAQDGASPGWTVRGTTAGRGPAMIVTELELRSAAGHGGDAWLASA